MRGERLVDGLKYAELHDKLGLGFELYTDRVFQVVPTWGVPFVIANTNELGDVRRRGRRRDQPQTDR